MAEQPMPEQPMSEGPAATDVRAAVAIPSKTIVSQRAARVIPPDLHARIGFMLGSSLSKEDA